jgi:hypothetical protein
MRIAKFFRRLLGLRAYPKRLPQRPKLSSAATRGYMHNRTPRQIHK